MDQVSTSFGGTLSSFDSVDEFLIVLAAVYAAITVLVLTSLAVLLAVAAVASPKRQASFNPTRAQELAGAFFFSLFAALGWALTRPFIYFLTILQYLWENKYLLVGVVLVSAITLGYPVYSPELKAAVIPFYQHDWNSFIYDVPMYIFLLIKIVFETTYEWINGFIIRLPSQLITGGFFDLNTCAREVWSPLFVSLVRAGLSLAPSFVRWSASGDARLTVAPDFAPFGQHLGEAIGSLQEFSECLCESGSAISGPVFHTFSEGFPGTNVTEETPPFAQLINSTLNLPTVLVTDFVRPFVLGVRASDMDFLDAWQASKLSFHGTSRTALRFVNSTFALADAFSSQVIHAILGAITDGSNYEQILVDPGPMPALFSCGTAFFWWTVDFMDYAFNLFANWPDIFTTYDGQEFFRLTLIIDDIRSSIDCLCQWVRWLSALLCNIGTIAAGNNVPCESGKGAADIGANTGACILCIVVRFFDLVCCALDAYVTFLMLGAEVLLELVVGTIYQVITRIIEHENNADWCDQEVIDPEFVNYCSVFQNRLNPAILLDYLGYQLGYRSDTVGYTVCPTQICNARQCETSDDCDGSAQAGVPSRCDTKYSRCLENQQSCASNEEPTTRPTPCYGQTDGGNYSIGVCSVNSCPAGPTLTFDYDCQCTRNEYLIVGLKLVEIVDCFGLFFVYLFGTPSWAVVSRCVATNIATLIIYGLIIIIEFIAQIDILLSEPSELEFSTKAFLRVVASIGYCVSDGLRDFVSVTADITFNQTAAFGNIHTTADDQELKAFTTIITGTIDDIVELFIVFIQLFLDFASFFTTWSVKGAQDIVGDITRIIFIFLNAFLYFFVILLKFASAFLALIDADAGLAIYEFAIELENELEFIVDAIITIVLQLITCLLAIPQLIIGLLNCLAFYLNGYGTGCFESGEWLFPLLDCFAELGSLIWELILQVINFIADNVITFIFCFIDGLLCFFGLDYDDFIDIIPCSSLSLSDCLDLNLFCNLEQFFCSIAIPISFGCDIPCGEASVICTLFAFVCAGSNVLTPIISTLESIPVIGLPDGTAKEYVEIAAGVPPITCCTTNGSSTINGDLSNYNGGYACSSGNVILTEGTGDDCPIIAKAGCGYYLNRTQLISLDYISCPSKKKRSVDEEIIDEATNYGPRSFDEATVDEIIVAIEKTNARGSLSATRLCVKLMKIHIDPTITWNEVVGYVQRGSFGMTERLTIGMCLDFLSTYKKDDRFGLYLTHHEAATRTPVYFESYESKMLRVLWPLTQSITVLRYATKFLLKDAVENKYVLASTRFASMTSKQMLVFGTANLQTQTNVCSSDRPGCLVGSVFADFFAPTIGTAMHIGVLSFMQGLERVRPEYAAMHAAKREFKPNPFFSHMDREHMQRQLNTILRVNGKIHKIIHSPDVKRAFAKVYARLTEDSKERHELFAATGKTKREISRPARSLQRLAASQRASRKRQEPRRPVKIRDLLYAQLPALKTMRLFDDHRRRPMVSSDECNLRQSPWECCPEQSVCLDCSVFDRVSYTIESIIDENTNYLQNDYRTRFSACSEQQVDTLFYTQIPANRQCPSAWCAVPQCSSNGICAQFGQNANLTGLVGPICNPNVRRCLLEGDGQCVGQADGTPCTVFNNAEATNCSLGACSGDACVPNDEPTFDCITCQCVDTFASENKTIPVLWNRFFDLRLPCGLNFTCILDLLYPNGVPNVTNTPNPFVGTFVQRKMANTPPGQVNYDLLVLDFLNRFNDFGTKTIEAIETTVNNLVTAGSQASFGNLLDNLFFCSFNDGWFCPLEDGSPRAIDGCCSDRCELRATLGIGLFGGLFWVFLLRTLVRICGVVIPPILICQPACSFFWAYATIPLIMQFAYGDGVLCYTRGLILLFIPIVTIILTILAFCVRCSASLLSNCIRCCRVTPIVIQGCMYACRLIGVFAAMFAGFYGLSMCTGADVYTYIQEASPLCFPTETALVDLTKDGALTECGRLYSADESLVVPSFINCVSDPRIRPSNFNNGLYTVFYIINWLAPDYVNGIVANQSAVPDFLQPYFDAHNDAVYAQVNEQFGRDVISACFRDTFVSIVFSLFFFLGQVFVAYQNYIWKIILLGLSIYPLSNAVRSTIESWHQTRKGFIEGYDTDGQRIVDDETRAAINSEAAAFNKKAS